MKGYCSWCLKEMTPTLAEQGYLTRNLYRCRHCAKGIVMCRACTHYACWDQIETPDASGHKQVTKEYNQFCSEHNGTLANFSTSTSNLSEPSAYMKVYEHRSTNMSKVSQIALCSIGGVAVAGPLALYAAPAIGGAIGGLMGLSGAAATSAGLALLGFGSLAAGGFGMAGGMIVLTVAGSAVGGALGAYVGTSYFGDIQGFHIRKLREGKMPAVITVNGFLSEGYNDTTDWAPAVNRHYSDHAWYHVDWESKNLLKLGSFMFQQGGKALLRSTLITAAQRATKEAAKRIGPAATLAQVVGLSTNPWHTTLVKAEKAGVLLADILGRCKRQSFVLFGHSLGARVIFSALQTLSTTEHSPVVAAHLYGGAVDHNADYWRQAKQAVSGSIFNYHSEHDDVLRYLYSAGTFFASSPIGRHPIQGVPGVVNIDVSSQVRGHGQFKPRARDYTK